MKEKVVIAGGSGFVGSALIDHLLTNTDYDIVALSRSHKHSDNPRVTWRESDLFSLLDIEEAIHDCTRAVYLVHSMLPSARLVQGDFADFDLTLADNFSRACEAFNLKSIVYLSGIIPEHKEVASSHLKSRREVEEVFENSKVPVTIVLRAGIVMGPQGSSFTILYNLINRLPVMFCPRWTLSKTAPVSIWDMVKAIEFGLSLNESKSYDVTNGESFSYQNMILRVAMAMGKAPKLVPVPYFSPRISKLWVTLVSGAPKELVYPLVMSLKNNMLPRKDHRLTEISYLNFNEYVQKAIKLHKAQTQRPKCYTYTPDKSEKQVRSIQRLDNTRKRSAMDVAHLYFEWLPRFFRPWINVQANPQGASFYIWGSKKPLLVLSFSKLRSTEDRPLYYITGGVLAKKTQRGRLEFRSVMGGKFIIAAIHEFKPKLPWYIYRYTQALIHLWVMTSFNKYLNRKH
ncbi:MAG: NAD(P)H-binding protein [Bdellovibrionales bacterium]|nr:NAD(P)H-binding protein [Bdellovibrionales bacterium]